MVKKKGSRPDSSTPTRAASFQSDVNSPAGSHSGGTTPRSASRLSDFQDLGPAPRNLLESLSKLRIQDTIGAPDGFIVDAAPVPTTDRGVTRHRHLLRAHMSQMDMVKNKMWVGQVIGVRVVKGGDDCGDTSNIVAIGTVWASPTCKEGNVLLSAQLRQNADIEIGAVVKLETVTKVIPEALRLVLRPSAASPDFKVDEALNILMKEILVDIRFVTLHGCVEATYHGKVRQFKVEKGEGKVDGGDAGPVPVNNPASFPIIYEVTRYTDVAVVAFERKSIRAIAPDAHNLEYECIGGLKKEVEEIRKIVEMPLLEPERFSRFGLRPPRGVLLYGPPGTGKTLVARVVAAETGAHVIIINGPDIISKFYGETEERLKSIFQEAEENAPAIIFIDEIDSICPKRDDSSSDLEKRVVTTLLTLMDGAHHKNPKKADGVVVIAATNRPNVLDDALRRPGRFDREIEIGIPNAHGRLDILRAQLRRVPCALSDEEIRDVAARAHGYVGADIAAIVREAGLSVVQRVTRDTTDSAALRRFKPSKSLDGVDLKIRLEDLNWAIAKIKPSAMREIMVEVPRVLWTDIGGQSDIKLRLKEAVEWPLKHPEVFERFKIKPPKGILLYGPPGCSKTLLAKALATEAGLNFLAVKGPELFSKWVGDSEKAVREVFKKARAASPSIIFFDEIDAIAVRRGSGDASVADRVLSQLLSEMDGVEPLVNVTVVAATNRPDILDSALLRPGRIDRILYVSPPDFDARKEILSIQKAKMACAVDVDVNELATKSEGFSGAEMVAICQEAALLAMEEDIQAKEVMRKHFLTALERTTPRITPEMTTFYDEFRQRSGLRSV